MASSDGSIRITLQDVYDELRSMRGSMDSRLNEHEDAINARIDAHETDDHLRFDALNLKVYGILGTVAACAVAVMASIAGVHL